MAAPRWCRWIGKEVSEESEEDNKEVGGGRSRRLNEEGVRGGGRG